MFMRLLNSEGLNPKWIQARLFDVGISGERGFPARGIIVNIARRNQF
jgi:hypothetical protein